MQIRHIDDFHIHERQRKLFKPKPLDDLADSIEAKGLMHPVVATTGPNGELLLVAGERRMRAMEKLHVEDRTFSCDGQPIEPMGIPFIMLEDLDEVGRKEAELEENILREDLTWQERNDAVAELHKLRLAQNPEHSRGDTVRELAEKAEIPKPTAYRTVSNAILLDNFKEDEEVQRAKTEREAVKIATRKLEEEFRAATQHPRGERGTYGCMQGDCRQIMGGLKAEMFTAIIADPPYGMGADEFGDAAQNVHHYDDSPEYALEIAESIFRSGHRIAKPNAHIFMFCDIDHFATLKELCQAAGWKPWRTPIIWSKGGMGHAPDPNRGPKRTFETILFAAKGDPRIKSAFSDVITVPPERERYHAAQKPPELYKYLLSQVAFQGDHVLDPCCGAGTIFQAAHALSLKCLGIEENERFFKLSQSIASGLK